MQQVFSYQNCHFCPRGCGADRTASMGYCQSPAAAMAARAALHFWEEPCISGLNGSGTIFFSGCTLRCCFCQNYRISAQGFGKAVTPERLAEIFIELQEQGAHNINLVTATQYLPSILDALNRAKKYLTIPVVYNCGGYEALEAIEALAPFVDIWLPDLKYFSSQLSGRYSGAPDYFERASLAIEKMVSLAGAPVFQDYIKKREASEKSSRESCLLMKKGVLIRHMVLPGQREDSIRLLHWIHDTLPKGQYLLSLLSQYTPFYQSGLYPEINRRLTTYEYEKVLDTAIALGLTDGFMQKRSSAKEEYTPPFELEGL